MEEPEPAMALETLFSRLDANVKGGQHKKSLKTVDEILRLAPDDMDALRAKLVLLIEVSRFDEALALLDNAALAELAPYEKAYCLYRSARFAEGLAALGAVPEERAVAQLQLEAQLNFRMGRYAEAISAYSELFQKHKLATLELRANVLAAYVAGGRAREVPAVMAAMKFSARDSFEIAFNAACALLGAGDAPAAEEQLLLAQRLGREALLEEELSEEQVEAELAPLAVQLGYAAGLQGRRAEALAAYDAVREARTDDEVTAAVAANNWVAERAAEADEAAPRKVFAELSKRLEPLLDKGAEARLAPALEARMSDAQKGALLSNAALLLLASGRTTSARELAAGLTARFPYADAAALVQAAIAVRDGDAQHADDALAAAVAAGGAGALPAGLLRAQLALASGDAARALAALEGAAAGAGLADWPAVLATRVELHERLGDAAGARALVQAALGALQGPAASAGRAAVAGGAAGKGVAWLLERLAQLQLQAGEVDGAFESYQALRAAAPSAPAAAALLGALAKAAVAAGADAAGALRKELPPAPALPSAQVDALEAAAFGSGAMRRRNADAAAVRPEGDGGATREKRKRKRKVRLPKGFDPANPGPPPDPERWLPKWQRSDFKRKKKRGAPAASKELKGSQGAGRVDESLDHTHTDVIDAGASEGGPTRPGPRGVGGNRKKKGRR
ncbi:hypothetical protein WJX81_004606 [Elliptochloris bilobata]|uniref:Signal recognition particle subunit SRP72 n=1 Tax=Elliptochloris bilobata TaxID=381761 RepID=A0AAW1RGA3_9CHLO